MKKARIFIESPRKGARKPSQKKPFMGRMESISRPEETGNGSSCRNDVRSSSSMRYVPGFGPCRAFRGLCPGV